VRILHWAVPYYRGFGGQSIFIERLALEFIKRGHEVAILTDNHATKNIPKDNSENQLNVYSLNLSPTNLDNRTPLKFAGIVEVIQKFNPDIIHIHNLVSL
jgi:hypothetical protein